MIHEKIPSASPLSPEEETDRARYIQRRLTHDRTRLSVFMAATAYQQRNQIYGLLGTGDDGWELCGPPDPPAHQHGDGQDRRGPRPRELPAVIPMPAPAPQPLLSPPGAPALDPFDGQPIEPDDGAGIKKAAEVIR